MESTDVIQTTGTTGYYIIMPSYIIIIEFTGQPPLSTGTEIKLVVTGSISSFDTTDFENEVAKLLDVPKSLVEILKVSEGSIIIHMKLYDRHTEGDAKDLAIWLQNHVKNGGSIGPYDVEGEIEVTFFPFE
jgi:hypothetical protein